ncbi:MAG: hypothetical protein ACLR6J_13435 [Parabacteroides merdae]
MIELGILLRIGTPISRPGCIPADGRYIDFIFPAFYGYLGRFSFICSTQYWGPSKTVEELKTDFTNNMTHELKNPDLPLPMPPMMYC